MGCPPFSRFSVEGFPISTAHGCVSTDPPRTNLFLLLDIASGSEIFMSTLLKGPWKHPRQTTSSEPDGTSLAGSPRSGSAPHSGSQHQHSFSTTRLSNVCCLSSFYELECSQRLARTRIDISERKSSSHCESTFGLTAWKLEE